MIGINPREKGEGAVMAILVRVVEGSAEDEWRKEGVLTWVARALFWMEASTEVKEKILEWISHDLHPSSFKVESLSEGVLRIVTRYHQMGMLDGLLVAIIHAMGPGMRRQIWSLWEGLSCEARFELRERMEDPVVIARDRGLALGLMRISDQAFQRWLPTARMAKRLIEARVNDFLTPPPEWVLH